MDLDSLLDGIDLDDLSSTPSPAAVVQSNEPPSSISTSSSDTIKKTPTPNLESTKSYTHFTSILSNVLKTLNITTPSNKPSTTTILSALTGVYCKKEGVFEGDVRLIFQGDGMTMEEGFREEFVRCGEVINN